MSRAARFYISLLLLWLAACQPAATTPGSALMLRPTHTLKPSRSPARTSTPIPADTLAPSFTPIPSDTRPPSLTPVSTRNLATRTSSTTSAPGSPTSVQAIVSPSALAAQTATPLPEGWIYHASGRFRLALPERWRVVDVKKQGWQGVLDVLEELDSPGARLTAEELARHLKSQAGRWAAGQYPEQDVQISLWAIDPQPSGEGNATLTLSTVPEVAFKAIGGLCQAIRTANLVNGNPEEKHACGLEINGLQAAWLLNDIPGADPLQHLLALYLSGKELWQANYSVEEEAWLEYEAIFFTSAQSFTR